MDEYCFEPCFVSIIFVSYLISLHTFAGEMVVFQRVSCGTRTAVPFLLVRTHVTALRLVCFVFGGTLIDICQEENIISEFKFVKAHRHTEYFNVSYCNTLQSTLYC